MECHECFVLMSSQCLVVGWAMPSEAETKMNSSESKSIVDEIQGSGCERLDNDLETVRLDR